MSVTAEKEVICIAPERQACTSDSGLAASGLMNTVENAMADQSIYASPREITDIRECAFYHVMDIPGYGVVGEGWDLRGREDEYLGSVAFKGKRVLELGTASGHLCRYMENRGADVVAYDLSENHSWDIVPFSQFNPQPVSASRRDGLRKINNGWWSCHRIFSSKANVAYGSIYQVPTEIGEVDISTFGSILLHVRDPFLALQSALRLTRETVIVTDVHPDQQGDPDQADSKRTNAPTMVFVPNFRKADPRQCHTWWNLYPQVIVEFLGVLGFENTTITYHMQKPKASGLKRLYTVVGTRTREAPLI